MHTSKEIIKYALLNALWTVLYIILVGAFFNSAENLFGQGKTILIPIAMLLLFVFSAALTGALVMGRPVLWYMEGKKKEALSLLIWTLAVLFVAMVIIFGILFMLK